MYFRVTEIEPGSKHNEKIQRQNYRGKVNMLEVATDSRYRENIEDHIEPVLFKKRVRSNGGH